MQTYGNYVKLIDLYLKNYFPYHFLELHLSKLKQIF